MKKNVMKLLSKVSLGLVLAGTGVAVQSVNSAVKVEAAEMHGNKRVVAKWNQSLGGGRWRRVYRYSDGSYGYSRPFYYNGWLG